MGVEPDTSFYWKSTDCVGAIWTYQRESGKRLGEHCLISSFKIVTFNQILLGPSSNRMRWNGSVARIKEMKDLKGIWAKNLSGKSHLKDQKLVNGYVRFYRRVSVDGFIRLDDVQGDHSSRYLT
jgi:hypothetical protein